MVLPGGGGEEDHDLAYDTAWRQVCGRRAREAAAGPGGGGVLSCERCGCGTVRGRLALRHMILGFLCCSAFFRSSSATTFTSSSFSRPIFCARPTSRTGTRSSVTGGLSRAALGARRGPRSSPKRWRATPPPPCSRCDRRRRGRRFYQYPFPLLPRWPWPTLLTPFRRSPLRPPCPPRPPSFSPPSIFPYHPPLSSPPPHPPPFSPPPPLRRRRRRCPPLQAWSECLGFRADMRAHNEERAGRAAELAEFEGCLWDLHDDLKVPHGHAKRGTKTSPRQPAEYLGHCRRRRCGCCCCCCCCCCYLSRYGVAACLCNS